MFSPRATSSLRSVFRAGTTTTTLPSSSSSFAPRAPTLRRTMSQLSANAQFADQHLCSAIGRLSKHVLVSGKGSYVTTDQDKTLLDFTSGIGVTNLGHCHPKVTDAAVKQVQSIVHAQVGVAYSQAQIDATKKILPLLPHPSLDSIFFWNSGSEAVEAATKLARLATKRQNIIVMQGSYHGRTHGAMAMTTSKTIYRSGTLPNMPGVFTTPFPYYSQLGVTPETDEETLSQQCLHSLRLLLKQQSAPSDTAAIVVEGVLGEGGYVATPTSFLKGLRQICDETGILLVVDEVQSGYGRTGKMWALDYSGVRPDVLISAKGLANGFPLSMIVASKELMDKQPVGSAGGTYAGNAVACAAAKAVVEAFEEEKILDNVQARSKQLFDFLHELKNSGSKAGNLIQDIRGKGLMVGLQFSAAQDGKPAPKAAPGQLVSFDVEPSGKTPLSGQITKECLERGMLLLNTSTQDTIRFIPPLNISEEDLAKGLQIFKEAFEAVAAKLP